ncbi:MAG: phosphotransferase [Beutenbergiaceae bacterium]
MTLPIQSAAVVADRELVLQQAPVLTALALGRRPEQVAVQVTAVDQRPGAGVSAVYRVSQPPVPDMLVASTAPGPADEADGVLTVSDGARRVRMWWRRHDPRLPGLRHAMDPESVARWLGIPQAPSLQVVSYRPGRRAVIAAGTGRSRWFIKVVRPDRADPLRRRHLMLGVPRLLGEPAPGVLVLEPAPGISLAQALAASGPEPLPQPEQILAFLTELPDSAGLPRRLSWADRSDFYASAACAELPDLAEEIMGVQQQLHDRIDALPAQPLVPTHGDLNVANLFVTEGRAAAVIDLDSFGPGYLIDDLATLLAHLHVLSVLAPQTYPDVLAHAHAWEAAWSQAVDAEALRVRTAAVVLSLIAGSGVDQARARFQLVRRLLANPATQPQEAA